MAVKTSKGSKKSSSLMGLYHAAKEICGDDVYFTVHQIEVFLLIAEHDGEMPMLKLIEISGLPKTSISRVMNVLGRYGSVKKEGRGLVDLLEDPEDRRRKIVRLTPKGRKLVDKLKRILED